VGIEAYTKKHQNNNLTLELSVLACGGCNSVAVYQRWKQHDTQNDGRKLPVETRPARKNITNHFAFNSAEQAHRICSREAPTASSAGQRRNTAVQLVKATEHLAVLASGTISTRHSCPINPRPLV